MSSMTQFIVIYYLFIWGTARIRGAFRRWRQPLLRGSEWFFNVHVRPDFYTGPGKKILQDYWIRMLATFPLEIAAAAAIFLSGRVQLLAWLSIAMAVIVHVNHAFNVDLAERKARQFALPEDEQPTPSVVLSLQTRRLRDYSHRKLEWAMALAHVGVFLWVVRFYLGPPPHHNPFLFVQPVLILYHQAGLLLVKQMVLAWRSPLPQSQTEEHIQAREETRKNYLLACDIHRVTFTAMLVCYPFLVTASSAILRLIAKTAFGGGLALGIVLLIWQEMRRKRMLSVALRARPVNLPNLLGQTDSPSWLFCYQPSMPMLVLKGQRGYSVNLAHSLAQLTAAYVGGFGVLIAVLHRMAH